LYGNCIVSLKEGIEVACKITISIQHRLDLSNFVLFEIQDPKFSLVKRKYKMRAVVHLRLPFGKKKNVDIFCEIINYCTHRLNIIEGY
jgi:hypothetical protein